MFLDLSERLLSSMTGRWTCSDHEEYQVLGTMRHQAGFQKWGYFMIVFFIASFLVAIFVNPGLIRSSLLFLSLVLSLLHLVIMVCARVWIKVYDPRELSEWYDGHMMNYAWAAVIAAGLLCFT